MFNIRNNQLEKIIITAMDRFVWFVLLVVFSHLVTEFTRVTGYTRGPRHDAVMVNDSLIRPIRVQNLVQYPGQEYGQYAPRNPPYYNGNSHYNNYDNNGGSGSDNNNNNNGNSNNNFLSNMFSGLFNQNQNNNNNINNNNNGQEYPQINSHINGPEQGGIRTLGMIRPIIDSIFDIPISTLRAVNNLVGRLTGSSYQVQPTQQQTQQQQQQQQNNQLPTQQQYFPSFLSLPSLPSLPWFQSSSPPSSASSSSSQPSYYGTQKSAAAQPKTEIEMLKRLRQLGSTNSDHNPQQTQQQQTSNVASI